MDVVTQPSLASEAASKLLVAVEDAAMSPEPRERMYGDTYWGRYDPHWHHTVAVTSLPFLTEIARCFAAGLFAGESLRRAGEVRTILIGRPRLRLQAGRLHADGEPAVAWADGSER